MDTLRFFRRTYIVFERRAGIFRLMFRINSTFCARARNVPTVRFAICSIRLRCVQVCRATSRGFCPAHVFTREAALTTTSIATSIRFNAQLNRKRMKEARAGLNIATRRLLDGRRWNLLRIDRERVTICMWNFCLVRRYIYAMTSNFVAMCASQAGRTSEELYDLRGATLRTKYIYTGGSTIQCIFYVVFSRRYVLRITYQVIFNGVRKKRCIPIIFRFQSVNSVRSRANGCVSSFISRSKRQVTNSWFCQMN